MLTSAPATWVVGLAATVWIVGGVLSAMELVVNCHESVVAKGFPGSELSRAVAFTRTRYAVVASSNTPAAKVICVASADQVTVPAVHAPSETRWSANVLAAPLADSAIPSDHVTWTRAFRGTLTAFGEIGRHTSELQSHVNLVCRLLLEKKKK